MAITLDNGRISSMVGNGEFIAAFPFLTLAIEQRACCGRVTGRSPDFDGIRRAIAGMPSELKTKMRQMLGGDEVVVHYNDGTSVQSVTF